MIELGKYFSIQIFFIILRETLETAIIISVLLSFINKREPKGHTPQDENQRVANSGLRLQVWLGAILGLLICLVIGLVFIGCFYLIETDLWSYTERLWEGVFSLLSSAIITVMGVGLLRINKIMRVKWWVKLGDAYTTQSASQDTMEADDFQDEDLALQRLSEDIPDDLLATLLLHPEGSRGAFAGSSSGRSASPLSGAEVAAADANAAAVADNSRGFSKKYFLAILPFITTLREGLEAVVFVGGIGMSQPASSLPLAIFAGLLLGSIVGYVLYRGGSKMSLQYFLICSTCFLYVVSAGLVSRGVWFLELERYVRLCGGLDVSETGSGPGSYDISTSVWHVNCCNGLTDGWWMVANALIGWTNSATYGSVFSYIGYWILVSLWLRIRLYEERVGFLPYVPIKWQLKRIKRKIFLYEARKLHEEDGSRA